MNTSLNLLVLRCKDIEATRQFYEKLGFSFVAEKHGAGPDHLASTNCPFVLELYPAAKDQGSDNVRLGFSVTSLSQISLDFQSEVISLTQTGAADGPIVLLLRDPDGRKVEIRQEHDG